MRFYLYDGKAKAALGPFSPEQLAEQPGFGAESLVALVGSTAESDWKPAATHISIRPFLRRNKCPKCAHPNPESSVFCNRCGARMSGEPPAPAAPASPPPLLPIRQPPVLPVSAPPPQPALPPPPQLPSPPAAPAPPPQLPPPQQLPSPPAAPAPLPLPPAPAPVAVAAEAPPMAARPKLKPTGMGRLAELEPEPTPPPPVFEAPAPKADWKTPALAGVAVAGAFVLFFLFSKQKAAAPPPAPEPQPAPVVAEAPPPPPPRIEAPPPPPPPKPVVKKAAPVRKKRWKKAAPAKSEAQLLEGLLKAGDKPAAEPAPDKPLALPGLEKPVDAKPAAADESAGAPELSSPALDAAKEQFEFCHALRRQGAFGDFFDTCMCPSMRKVDREDYVDSAKTLAQGQPEQTHKITDARLLDPSTAMITANWTAGGVPAGRRVETWKLEEGLWCLERR